MYQIDLHDARDICLACEEGYMFPDTTVVTKRLILSH